MYLLDTDTLTWLHLGRLQVIECVRQVGEENVATTVISEIEILGGRHAFLLKARDSEQLLRAPISSLLLRPCRGDNRSMIANEFVNHLGVPAEHLQQTQSGLGGTAPTLFPTLQGFRRHIQDFGKSPLGKIPFPAEHGHLLGRDFRRRQGDHGGPQRQFPLGKANAFFQAGLQVLKKRIGLGSIHW